MNENKTKMYGINIDDILNFHVDYVVDKICKSKKLNKRVTFEQFKLSKTYKLLFNLDSKLYLESSEYVLDMYENELDENWEEWLKI